MAVLRIKACGVYFRSLTQSKDHIKTASHSGTLGGVHADDEEDLCQDSVGYSFGFTAVFL
jgi:hypothetical protein